MRPLNPFILTVAALVAPPLAQAAPSADDLMQLHQEIGRKLDAGYYDAGRRIDVAGFDLAELRRQGRAAPETDVRQVAEADAALRQRFVELDTLRAALRERIVKVPPTGDVVLEFEVVSEDGERPWLGVAGITLAFDSGGSVHVPLTTLRNGAFRRNYKYHVPPRDAAFIYGRPSPTHAMQAAVDLPRDGVTGPAELVLVALDDLKPGQTPIAIRINGVEVFRGDAGFSESAWSERRFAVPAHVLTNQSESSSEPVEIAARLAELREQVATFATDAARRAEEIDGITASSRAGLIYQPLAVEREFWRNGFVRGMCVAMFTQDEEHHAKWLHSLGVNLVYSYAGRYSPEAELPKLLRWTRELGLPVFQNPHALSHTSKDSLKLGRADELVEQMAEYLATVAGNSGVHLDLAADEPNFRDVLAELPAVQDAFRRYLEQRRPALAAAGVALPANVDALPPVRGAGDAQVLWMEWQLFRRDYLAEHFAQLWQGLASRGVTPFTIIQFHAESEPQLAAYSSMGRTLPLISTDIYRDGAFVEPLGVDLLQNAGEGTTVFTAGAGYSGHEPRTFARSIATAMAHADGLLEWTDIYLAKHRDPQAFWRSAGDDRGRSVLDNWDPSYWAITQTMYQRMREADVYLGHAESAAQVAVLVSERSLIADGPKTAKAVFDAAASTYATLLRAGVPVDGRLVESSPLHALEQYRVVFLPEARTLASGELDALRSYVRGGGVLVASGTIAATDEWGRPLAQSALRDLVGSEGAVVMATFENGTPAVTHRTNGDGAVYLAAGPHAMAPTKVRSAGGGDSTLAAFTHGVLKSVLTSSVTLVDGVAGVELQVRRKAGALLVHAVDWSDHGERSSVRVRLTDANVRAFDPTRPGHPALAIESGVIEIPLVHGHGMAVLGEVKVD